VRKKPLVRLRSKIQFHLIIASAYAGKLSLLSYLPPPYPRSLGGLTHELGANRSLRLTSSVVGTTPALDNDLVHLSSLIKKLHCISYHHSLSFDSVLLQASLVNVLFFVRRHVSYLRPESIAT